MEANTPIRIPRPQGATVKAKEGNTQALYHSISEAFIRGLFPLRGPQLSLYKFASLYKVPMKVLESHVKDGLAHNLIEDDGDLAKKLEAERLRLFSSSLFRIGNSDRVLNATLEYLTDRVLNNRTAHPLVVKELNSSIGSQIKLTETSLKAITMLNDALSTVAQVQDVSAEEQLTREEILKEMETIKITQVESQKYLEGTPNITPLNLTKKKANLQPGTDSYQKFPEAPETKVPPTPVILPQ